MAHRAAEAGLRVCVLERGRAYPPGSFPRAPHEMRDNFWEPKAGLQGLFQVWRMKEIDALVSSGLGGGSLIYANVLLRKDERWFVDEDGERWPVTRADLDPHYDRVERLIGVARYPEHLVQVTPKSLAYRAAAAQCGFEHGFPPLAVSFGADGEPLGQPIKDAPPHLHGPHVRTTCRLCGECDIGCNYGSKNTLDFNLLSSARNRGAVIRTRCEVRRFRKTGDDAFAIDLVDFSAADGGQPQTVSARQLVLAAGTLGSTFLLLKNQHHFPGASRRIGTQFSGNGDFLGMALNAKDAMGKARLLDPGQGPVITSFVRQPDAADGGAGSGRGFYIEDAGYPDFFNWMAELGRLPMALGRVARYARNVGEKAIGLDRDTNLGAEIAELIGSCDFTKSVQPMLGMGRDVPGGRFFINDDGHLDLDWPAEKSNAFFDRMNRMMADMAHALGAEYVPNPLSSLLQRLITVHPLGGCPMGRTPDDGAVDPWGEVFGAPGLFVADGAAVPGPVGANPSLTIAALSDRFADRVIEKARARA